MTEWEQKFRDDLARDMAFESRLIVKEIYIVAIIIVLIVLRELWL
jgi:hypothetical protein